MKKLFAVGLGALGSLCVAGAACSSPSATPETEPVPRGEVPLDAGSDAAAEASAPDEPDIAPIVGLEALSASAFEQLPFLRRATRLVRETSYDRKGGNDDY